MGCSVWAWRRGGRLVLLGWILLGWILLGWILLPQGLGAEMGGERLDFSRDIRPILAENCFFCHGQDGQKREADLRLDDRAAALAAGAIVPGDPGASTALEQIHSSDPDLQMPPPDSNRKLSQEQKRLLDRWIKAGAEYAPHWAFVAPQRPPPPTVQQADWPRNDIDRFVLAKLEAAGLQPSPEADRATLIRRLHADLTGLPPTPEEVDAFVADSSPDAYVLLANRLLASPHYGERMALPWLDAARYADSNGFQQDGDTWQWIWRDWVVNALNADLPFDQFSIEQLAGDLLPDATLAQRIATGFNRNHLLNGDGGAIAEEQRFNNLFDRVDTTSTTWLALTVACAQCHDHKYDPLTQTDYYGLLDAFNRLPESGAPTRFSARIRVAPPLVEAPDEPLRRQLADTEQLIAALGEESPAEVAELRRELAELRADRLPRVMVMSDDKPRQTRILDRGDYLAPVGEKLTFLPPASLPPLPAGLPRNRLGLAKWLFLPEHPLTARVQVNRMWQQFVGMGIVKTTEDMGVQSEYPHHLELLDWLAVEFRERGWSQKQMHRLLVTSATSLPRGVCGQSPAAKSRHGTREKATSASNARPRPVGMGTTVAPREAAATQIRVTSHARTTPHAQAWAKLMARVGEEFPLECPNCGGDIRLFAFITEPGPILKILTHLGEPLEPPPVSPARGPPTDWGELVQAHDDRAIFQATDRRAARDRHPPPLNAAGREASKRREQPTGSQSAPRREKRRCRGVPGDHGNGFEPPETPAFAAHGHAVGPESVVEVPLAGLSFSSVTMACSMIARAKSPWLTAFL